MCVPVARCYYPVPCVLQYLNLDSHLSQEKITFYIARDYRETHAVDGRERGTPARQGLLASNVVVERAVPRIVLDDRGMCIYFYGSKRRKSAGSRTPRYSTRTASLLSGPTSVRNLDASDHSSATHHFALSLGGQLCAEITSAWS
jgi:hypothetical protein